MKIINTLVLLLVSFHSIQIYSNPPEYFFSRGTRPLLVNYGAIKNNLFLCKIAQQRFEFIDEARKKEINFIRKIDPDYLILHYKDIVGVYPSFPEYSEINLNENAFLHTYDPANINVLFDDSWIFRFTSDERFQTVGENPRLGYKLYYSLDSLTFTAIDSIFKSTEIKVSLPKSAKYVKINTIVDDSLEIEYSFVAKLAYDTNAPLIFPSTKKTVSSTNIDTIKLTLEYLNNIIPDSLILFIDLNKDNKFTALEEIISRKFTSKKEEFAFNTQINNYKGGYEFYILTFKNGFTYRFPREGYWITNPNNRIKNPGYGFFVTNVGDSTWHSLYIEEHKKALENGYNGIFIDDCWYFVGNWAVDAMPPYAYSPERWLNNIYEFLRLIRKEINEVPIFINGLWATQADTLLNPIDGGMTEGFATNKWSGFVSSPNWQNSCNLGLTCQHKYKKRWLALGGIIQPKNKSRLYCLGSYLLIFDSLSYFGNATSYQDFEHYPEFDIPLGKPLSGAMEKIDELKFFDQNNKPYYKRDFENITVFVNPSKNDTIVLPEIKGKAVIDIDTLRTIEGGRLTTSVGNEFLMPNEAKLILKGDITQTTLTSPCIRNPKAIAEQISSDSIRLIFSVEVADSSSPKFYAANQNSLYVVADLTNLLTKQDIILQNDGSPAGPNFSEYKTTLIVPSGLNLQNQTVPFIAYSPTGLFSVSYATIETKNIDTKNMILNFSFEFDVDEDGKPDFWNEWNQGYYVDSTTAYHGEKSILLENQNTSEVHGISCVVDLNQTEPIPLKISGYSKAENVDGVMNNDYSVYVDFYYNDGTPLYGQTAKFNVGSHDWEFAEKIVRPEKPIKTAAVYCLLRNHSGKVWFDKISLEELKESNFIKEFENSKSKLKIMDDIITDRRINIYSSETAEYQIFLSNLLGSIVWVKKIKFTEGLNIINLDEFRVFISSGIYFLNIQNLEGSSNKVFIIF